MRAHTFDLTDNSWIGCHRTPCVVQLSIYNCRVLPFCGFHSPISGFPDALCDRTWIRIFWASCGFFSLLSDSFVDAWSIHELFNEGRYMWRDSLGLYWDVDHGDALPVLYILLRTPTFSVFLRFLLPALGATNHYSHWLPFMWNLC